MSYKSSLKTCVVAVVLAAVALPVAFADSASRYAVDGRTYYSDGSNDVIIHAPRRERSAIGAPIQTVFMDREVYYGDLNLRTNYGANALKARIRIAATKACDELDARYPITAQDSPDCFKQAVARGYEDADDAIGRARNYRR